MDMFGAMAIDCDTKTKNRLKQKLKTEIKQHRRKFSSKPRITDFGNDI